MYKYRFHEIWVLPLLALLLSSNYTSAQCPLTQSTTFAMVQKGLPSLEKIQPNDFFIHPADTALYTDMLLSINHFQCVDIGIQEVLLTGVGPNGLPFTCEEYVWVYDSVFLCNDEIFTPRAVAGKIITEKNVVVPNIAIGLSSGNVNYFKGTNERGNFFFNEIIPQPYELEPGLPFRNHVRNGISTFDLHLLQKHILGLKKLDSPYKLIAADLNSSGDITAYDMLILRQMILSVIDEFPKTPSWKFVDAGYEFENPEAPYKEDYPSSMSLDMTDMAPQLNTRFIAIKMGDMNNSVKLENIALGRNQSANSDLILPLKNQAFTEGELVKLPVMFTDLNQVNGLQFSLSFDEAQLEVLEVAGNELENKKDYFQNENQLNFSWLAAKNSDFIENDLLVEITFIAKKKGELAKAIHLNTQQIAPEIYVNEEVKSFEIGWMVTSEKADFQVFNNYPNPFSHNTTIPFLLPANSLVNLQIFDTNGRIVWTQSAAFSKGENRFDLQPTFSNSGLYFYQLESAFGVVSGRMNYLK